MPEIQLPQIFYQDYCFFFFTVLCSFNLRYCLFFSSKETGNSLDSLSELNRFISDNDIS